MDEKIDISPSKDEDLCATDHLGINILNNDCLRYVFQYLPIVEKIRLERVCKRWQMISLESWSDFKVINFDNECWGFSKPKEIEKINSRIFKKVLNRCGQYLLYVEFSENNKRLGPNVLNVVAKCCPNIEHISAGDLDVSPWSIRALADRCRQITSFSIGGCTDECDDELSLLFKRNEDLKILCIYSNFEVTGECLLHLNEKSIETIIFENCPAISLSHFSVVKNFQNLRVLMIEHYHDINSKTIGNISACAQSLQFLTLAMCPFYSGSLRQIAKLTNLESLDLSCNVAVDDELLIAIGAQCKQLKRVDISYCNSLTDTGLASIVSLPKLKTLFMEDLSNVTDQVFNSMPSLSQMDCSYCLNVKDAGLVRLIESSENIEHLYLSNCKSITNELLEEAIRITKKRKSNVVLKLHLSHTNIKLSKVSGYSPFLAIIPSIQVTLAK